MALHKNALPSLLFRRLVRAVHAVGTERLRGNGSYTTTFWFPLGAKPRNVVEECIVELLRLAQPGASCTGMEWWLGRLRYGKALKLHFDRDLSLKKLTGRTVHPLWSSILYLNRFATSPTVILDQVPGADGKPLPPVATWQREIDPVPNHYVVYRGDLRHGVIPKEGQPQAAGLAGEKRRGGLLRLSLLVNYWERRPMPPICRDYDGSIYPALRDAEPAAAGASSAAREARARPLETS